MSSESIWQEPYVDLIRVSTSAQAQADTHEKQRYELDRGADAHAGATRVARIEAPGVSGTLGLADSDEGRELTTLAGKFKVLRITKINRVFGGRSEDPLYKAEVASLCFRTGATLLEVSTGQSYDPRDPVQQIMLMIALGFSAKERADLVENTNKGRFRRARANGSPGGRRYYGRRWNNVTRKWEYDEAERDIFDQIKAWILDERLSLNEVARRLNKMHVPSALSAGKGMDDAKRKRSKRNAWHGRTIASMLRQRHLVGESFYTNAHVPGEKAKLTIPPLLTEAEWQQIQDVLDTRHKAGRPADPTRAPICLGRVRCPCGARMYEKKGYYYCSTAHSNARVMGVEPCPYVKYHQFAAVDAAAWQAIVAYVKRDVIARAADPDDPIDIGRYREDVDVCESELTALKKREGNVGRTYAEGQMSDDAWTATHKRIRETQAKLEARMREAQHTVARFEASQAARESLDAAISRVRDRIRTAPPQDRRAMIHAIIPDQAGYGIVVQPDGAITIDAGLIDQPDSETGSGGGRVAASGGIPKVASPACP